jgi:PKD repeat protein
LRSDVVCRYDKEGDMTQRIRWQTVRAVVGSLAVIAAGCGTQSEFSPVGPTVGFSAGTIAIAPAGAIVGTWVILENRLASDPTGNSLSFTWDFGDGDSATGEATSHVYTTPGDYYATVTVSSSEGGSAVASLHIPVRSLTARWSGGPSTEGNGRVSITQDGLDLRGTYQDDSRQGIVEGRISEKGTVTFTVTSPGLAPVTFTGTAGPDVVTLVGAANGPDVVDRPWTLSRN